MSINSLKCLGQVIPSHKCVLVSFLLLIFFFFFSPRPAQTHTHTHWYREEIERQKAKVRYMKMHCAGKTDQAKADLARLAIIRKEREEAARKKEEEKKGRKSMDSNYTCITL